LRAAAVSVTADIVDHGTDKFGDRNTVSAPEQQIRSKQL
jgi:hypothetical protein